MWIAGRHRLVFSSLASYTFHSSAHLSTALLIAHTLLVLMRRRWSSRVLLGRYRLPQSYTPSGSHRHRVVGINSDTHMPSLSQFSVQDTPESSTVVAIGFW